MIAAIIPAAGSGERFGKDQDGKAKQFLQLAGKPLYEWSLKELCAHEDISQIVLLVPAQEVESIKWETSQGIQMSKVSVIAGGASRQQSVVKGLSFLSQSQPPPDYVLVHDAARPMLSQKMIQDTMTQSLNSVPARWLYRSQTRLRKLKEAPYPKPLIVRNWCKFRLPRQPNLPGCWKLTRKQLLII